MFSYYFKGDKIPEIKWSLLSFGIILDWWLLDWNNFGKKTICSWCLDENFRGDRIPKKEFVLLCRSWIGESFLLINQQCSRVSTLPVFPSCPLSLIWSDVKAAKNDFQPRLIPQSLCYVATRVRTGDCQCIKYPV